jgi:hypothetical protein
MKLRWFQNYKDLIERCAIKTIMAVWFCLLSLLIFGFTEPNQKAEGKADNFLKDLTVAKPVQFKNLTIFPIITTKSTALDFDIITLDEGLKSGMVVVTERSRARLADLFGISLDTLSAIEAGTTLPQTDAAKLSAEEIYAIKEYLGGGSSYNQRYNEPEFERLNMPNQNELRDPVKTGDNDTKLNHTKLTAAQQKIANDATLSGDSVNQLLLRNDSDKHLYLMAGEVVKGARQDRIIGNDTVIKPHSGWVVMDVFCVEHGRWSYEGSKFEGTGEVGHSTLRYVAQRGKEQGEVWEEVAAKRADLGKSAGIVALPGEESGTMEAAYSSEQVQAMVKPYVEAMIDLPKLEPHTLGVVVCYGDKLLATDIFGSETLFAKLYPQLLESYAMDVVGKEAPKKQMTTADIEKKLIALAEQGVGAPAAEKGSYNRENKTKTAFENQYDGAVMHINAYE